MRLFYDHLIIELEDVYVQIHQLKITDQEKHSLAKTIDETSHHHILDTILTHLDKKHHETFLHEFHLSPHDAKHLEFLKKEIADIEVKIRKAVSKLKKQLLREFISQNKQS